MVALLNPFKNSKAKDLSIRQINEYWVDYPNFDISKEIIAPHSLKPIIIKGSKGTGKSHIFLYNSINAVMDRSKNKHFDLLRVARETGFIAIYVKMSGILSYRFGGNSIGDDQWMNVFQNYLNLYIAVRTINDLKDLLNQIDKFDHVGFMTCLCSHILTANNDEIKTLDDLQQKLLVILSELDRSVNNSAIDLQLRLPDISFNTSLLVTELPKYILSYLGIQKGVNFLYFIDEIEEFTEFQQRYINTLLRSVDFPVSIRLGTRLYGHRTDETLTDERIKHGAEYEQKKLDDYFQVSQDYKSMCASIVFKRLKAYNYTELNEAEDLVPSFFESGVTHSERESKIMIRLRSNLKLLKLKPDEIDSICGVLADEDIYIEACKIIYFYKSVSSGINTQLDDLLIEVNKINISNEKFIRFRQQWSKHIQMIVNKLHSKPMYYGFETYINLSGGILRNLLDMLSETYDISLASNESPFREGKLITLKSQSAAISLFAKWFYADAIAMCSKPEETKMFIDRLGQYFYRLFYSDKPSEVETAGFYIDDSDLNLEQKEIINDALDHSLLVQAQPRKGKNVREEKPRYNLMVSLSPLWSLPYTRRSSIGLNKAFVEYLFNSPVEEYRDFVNEKMKSSTFPFSNKRREFIERDNNQDQITFL